jgi:vacuolar-type H+-ATPase subunit H
LSRKDRQAPPPGPPPLTGSTAERLAAIVEAAERAAVTVIDDAEKQAQRQLEQARTEADRLLEERIGSLAELTDSLLAQAEAIRAQSEQLLGSLAEAKRQLAAEDGDEVAVASSGPRPVRGSHLSAVAPVEVEPAPGPQPLAVERRGAPSSADADTGTAAGARLLATQMAVSGNSREEIEQRLRNDFEIEDTASILDAILGTEE